MSKYYLIGSYNEIPVYYSRTDGLLIGSKADEFEEPTDLEEKTIIAKLGGMKGIELIVHKYEKSEMREVKQNGISKKTI